MVNKKKNKNRQQGPDEQNASDSTESCDESQTENAGGKCPHIPRAVDFPQVKKSLKSTGIHRECMDCSRKQVSGDISEDKEVESQTGLWLCLKCGHQSCGRDRGQHALQHHQTPRSDSHALVVHTELWQVWCYECSLEIPSTSKKKKLHECLEFIKRQGDAPPKPTKPAVNIIKADKAEPGKTVSNAIVRSNTTAMTVLESKDLPRVRGLRNNGNTCFFNAVLQCLAHTPFLLPVLEETKDPGDKFTLPGGTVPGSEEEFLPISGELGKWGALTETLANTLSEVQSGAADVYNPAPLLNKLMQKCPLFEGGDQHDSQELLRHLLEGVRTEDLKRYQNCILESVGLSPRTVPGNVEDKLKVRVKFYGRQASDLCLIPDQVFRGSLVSTLECQDCLHVSQRTETFLDLSLPVMADKPQPPIVLRRKSSEETMELNQPSKHQIKKEKKIARKGKKRQAGTSKNRSAEGGQPTIDEENTNASGESEQSDADVEDNLEQDGPDARGGKDVGESGYSSEKAANEDSAIDSPVSHVLNGDSALASPASPDCREDRGSPIPLPYVSNGLPIPLPFGEGHNSLTLNIAEEVHEAEEAELFVISDLPARQVVLSPVNEASLQFATSYNLASHDIMNPAFDEAVDLSTLSDHELVSLDQLCEEEFSVKGTVIPSNEELTIVIPSSPRTSHMKQSPMSQGSLSPPSSDINLELASPSLCLDPSSTSSPLPDLERPGSRFAFNAEDSVDSPAPGLLSKTKPTISDITACVNGDDNLEFGMTNLSLDMQAIATSSDVVKIEISQEEINQCLHELSKEELLSAPKDEQNSFIGDSNICNKMDENDIEVNGGKGDEIFYGPLPMPSQYKEDVANHLGLGEVYTVKERSVSNSSTLSPKYTTDDGECSVMSCLNQFTSVELMTGNNKVGCEACSEQHNKGKEGKMVLTNSTKQFLISSPPPVLILHLKRFQLQRSLLKKMARHVSFPRVLDLAPLISTKSKDDTIVPSGQSQVLYSLYGIVEHSGTLQYGHYIAYVKVRAPLSASDPRWRFIRPEKPESRGEQDEACKPPSEPHGKWYCVSDSRVNEVSEEKVMKSEAYLLFYERIW